MKVQLRGGQQGLRALGRSIRTLERLVTRQVLKIVFDVLLLTAGLLLVVASRFRRRIQSQITRDVLFEIASDDGVARRFGLHAATRTVSLEAVSEQRPDTTVRFGCALDGIRALVSTRTTAHIVEGMNYGNTRLEGNSRTHPHRGANRQHSPPPPVAATNNQSAGTRTPRPLGRPHHSRAGNRPAGSDVAGGLGGPGEAPASAGVQRRATPPG